MKRGFAQSAIVFAVLLVAVLGIYFVFKGPGLATRAPPIYVTITEGVAFPEEFRVDAPQGSAIIQNSDAVKHEVELLRGEKIIGRRDVSAGKEFEFERLRRGDYFVVVKEARGEA